MTIDVSCLVGPYPFRHVPHPEPDVLVRVLVREGIEGAWVGHLPSAFYRDPAPGNSELFEMLAPHHELRPAPVVRPDWPHWQKALAGVIARGAVAIRAYPPQWGLGADDVAMASLSAACGEAGVPLLLTVRFEDLRQRHGLDRAGDLTGAAIRAAVRASREVRVVVSGAGRALIEEVHWGLTPSERARCWWDIAWIWGPPEDDLAHLLRSMGPSRFLYGSMWPLRLTQAPRANLELLPDELDGAVLASAVDIGAAVK
ncbi:MAG: amidohydrolase [Gemmatimonadota bacterium]|nr:amidohydrolase [Gemmatimonadota bacterium]